MRDIAIKCEGLSKRYRIGEQERYKALRDVIADGLYAPIKWARTALDGRRMTVDGNGAGPRSSFLGHPSSVAGRSDHIWALDDVSFEVKHGEVVGIIGRNGAGKSTLLKILSRITKPTKGQAEIHGRVGSLLEVGTGFHPELTGRENIYLNGAILGMRRAEIDRKFDEIVAFAEVERFIDTPVKRYSSGMYVRLAFAVAAHMETEILLVDEVLAVGDAQFQKKCLKRMQEVGGQGRTVLFVSHDMTAIQTLCPRALYLEAGRIVGEGTASEQIESYLNDYGSRKTIDSSNSLSLSESLKLHSFRVTPNPVVSGDSAIFQLELYSPEDFSIKDVAILILDSLGRRTAILDLRQPDGTYRADASNILRISAEVKRLPFVEGEYSLGLWLDAHEIRKDFFDLSTLTVLTKQRNQTFVPHHSSLRGMVELEYSLETTLTNVNSISD